LAKALYERSLVIPALRPAAVAAQELLSGLDRLLLKFTDRGDVTYSDHNQLMQQIAELGAELCPNSLDDVWERAGGQRERLSTTGTPAIRWREAVMDAHRGALPGGALALVSQLQRDFPYHAGLRRIREVLAGFRQHE
jgi:hypothetical protein